MSKPLQHLDTPSNRTGQSMQCITALSNTYLDWRKLVALGVSESDAKTICERLQIMNLVRYYCKKLVQSGIPNSDAKSVALAIANFDIRHLMPTDRQCSKLHQHALSVCRANLWRSHMFLT